VIKADVKGHIAKINQNGLSLLNLVTLTIFNPVKVALINFQTFVFFADSVISYGPIIAIGV